MKSRAQIAANDLNRSPPVTGATFFVVQRNDGGWEVALDRTTHIAGELYARGRVDFENELVAIASMTLGRRALVPIGKTLEFLGVLVILAGAGLSVLNAPLPSDPDSFEPVIWIIGIAVGAGMIAAGRFAHKRLADPHKYRFRK